MTEINRQTSCCNKCGRHLDDISQEGKFLKRTNDLGESFIGVCAPNCEHNGGNQETALLGALDAERIVNETHAILDADDSQIIRNAKDGYPVGREPHELTLQERVKALCKYAADWKKWYLDTE